MKVAYLLNKSIISGPNIVALSNAESLLSLGVDITVIFLYGNQDIEDSYPFLKKINCIYLNASKKNILKKVNDVINKNRIDIVHSHGFFPDFYNAFSKAKIKFTTIHNIPHEDYLLRYGSLKGTILNELHKIIMRKIKNIICISETVFSVLSTALNKNVIYNPVRNIFFDIGKNKKDKSNRMPTFLYCGHFTYLKNPEEMIIALKDINKEFKMICVGDGPLLKKCKEIVISDPRFIFIGRKNNVPLYFEQSDILLHFSKTEGFCLSVAEALVSGMKVIVNDIPIFRELKSKFDIHEMNIIDKKNEIKQSVLHAIESFESHAFISNMDSFVKYNCLKESVAAEKIYDCYRGAYARVVL